MEISLAATIELQSATPELHTINYWHDSGQDGPMSASEEKTAENLMADTAGVVSTQVRNHPVLILKRYLLLMCAWCFLALGVIGIFIPGLPTTVFILLAGWAASQSSPRFSRWLENHKLFGPMLRNWRETRSVSRKAKWSATVTMVVCAVILFLTAPHLWIAETISVVMAIVLVWLWYRPEPQ